MSSTLTVAGVVALLDRRYPPELAEEWDAVGLICGRPQAAVNRVLLAVDPDPSVVAEAADLGADLIVVHHPLFLRGVHGVPATDWKGRLLHDLVERGISMFCAHTNADVATDGVSDALGQALGLLDIGPLTHLPGLGRVGRLESPQSLGSFADQVARTLPIASPGFRVAGDLGGEVSRVAVCGGAGDSLLPQVRESGADVFVTADLRHHVVSDGSKDDGPALVDVGHWTSERPWLDLLADRLTEDASAAGTTVEATVSTVVTDPWTCHRPFDP